MAPKPSLTQVLDWRGPDGQGVPLKRWLLLCVLLCVYAWGVAAQAPILAFVAAGLSASVLWPCAQRGRQLIDPELKQLPKWVEPLLVGSTLAAIAWATWRGVYTGGHIADTKDHHIMLARTQELVSALKAGRIQYYTQYLQGGDALWDLYPILPALAVTAIDSALPASVSFDESYTIMVVGTWWLRGVAVYALSRRFSPVLPSILLTMGALYDVGESVWDGTWAATIHWGMVHSNLGLSLAGIAVAYHVDVLRNPRPGKLWLCALFHGLALLAHPLAFLYLALSGLLSLGVAKLGGLRWRRLFWLGGGVALGCCLAAWWFVPYLHNLKVLGTRFPWPGETFSTLGNGLLDGARPRGEFGAFHGLAVLASGAALFSKRPVLKAQAIVSLILWCAILSPLMIRMQVFELLPSLKSLQPTRFFSVLKISSVPALATGIVVLMKGAARISSTRVGPTLLRAPVFVLLIFGLLHSVDAALSTVRGRLLGQAFVAGASATPTGRDSEVDADLQAAMDWIAARRKADPSPTPWRLGVKWDQIDQWGLWRFPWRMHVPLVQLDQMPGNFLGIKPQHTDEECFQAWNVRYVLTRNKDAGQAAVPLFPQTVQRFSAGRYHVWELSNYDARFVVPQEHATISNLKIDGDEIRFKVSDAAGPVTLQIRTAWYPRWRAFNDGKPLMVSKHMAHRAASDREEQVSIVAHNGEVVLRCDGPIPRGALGLLLTFFGLLAAACLSVGSIRRVVHARLSQAAAHGLKIVKPYLVRSLRFPVAASASVVLIGVMLLLSRSFGASAARIPGPFGGNVSFSLIDSAGQRFECPRDLYGGVFHCPAIGQSKHTTVRNDMGREIGFAGEFYQLWPGIRFRLPAKDVTLQARFPQMATAERLKLRFDSYYPVEVSGSLGGSPFPSFPVFGLGDQEVIFEPPASGELVLNFKATTPETDVVFAAEVLR